MGQQQLLLLVLSTVIVGLATVAGIQAFSENQEQARQDALVQRATSIGSDIAAVAQKPTQMGGVSLGDGENTSADGAGTVANRIGLSGATGIEADGAAEGAKCKITSVSGGTATVTCDDDGDYDSGQTVEVTVDPDGTNPVNVASITVTS